MTELEAILRTIREVETSLERRSQRASALVMMTWGVVATAIFVFYGFVERSPEPFDALGPLVRWAWIGPIVLGYLITTMTQVRLGRARATAGASSIKRLAVLILLPIALLVIILVSGSGWQLIPAMWVAFLGFTHFTWHEGGGDALGKGIAFASFAAAILLALPPLWEWANFLAAGWYAVFLAGHGIYRYYAS